MLDHRPNHPFFGLPRYIELDLVDVILVLMTTDEPFHFRAIPSTVVFVGCRISTHPCSRICTKTLANSPASRGWFHCYGDSIVLHVRLLTLILRPFASLDPAVPRQILVGDCLPSSRKCSAKRQRHVSSKRTCRSASPASISFLNSNFAPSFSQKD